MDAVYHNPLSRITDLVTQQSQAITQLLSIEAAVRRRGTSEQDLTNAEQAVVEVAKLIALTLEPL